MYKREISDFLLKTAPKYPILTLIGPRQSGKSTLCKAVFPSHKYLSMEEPDVREMALSDPRSFFSKNSGDLIIDEVQRAPDLLSYIQTIVDDEKNRRHFVLTGSHQILLMEKVSQSLAGRTVICKLLPFSRREIWEKDSSMSLDELMITGGYPRIYDKKLEPRQWLEQYFQTYVEKDVRALINIGELEQFERFIRLCAGRVGQLANFSSLAADCGVSQPTAKAWFSALKTSFICYDLQPHNANFNKRIIKTPKIYFHDTGLVCALLKIKDTETLSSHPLRGYIFENFVIGEHIKSFFNKGEESPVYFWQSSKNFEVDLLIDKGTFLYPIEIKSSATFHPSMFKNIEHFTKLQKAGLQFSPSGECIYGGDESFDFKECFVRSWRDV